VPGFKIAIKQFKAEETIDAVVNKITPFGVFVILTESNLEAKLAIDDNITTKINNGEIALEKSIQVKIKHLTSERIVIEAP
jgi:ribosomal protein S1